MRILIYLAHPAQFHFFRNPVNLLRKAGHTLFILCRDKDVLTCLLEKQGWEFYRLMPAKQSNSIFALLKDLIIRDLKLIWFAWRHKIDLMAGSDPCLAHASMVLRIPCITVTEDDYRVIRKLAWLTYPLTNVILTPDVCCTGPWEHKKFGYSGYMKISHLHPNWFTPNYTKLQLPAGNKFTLIRLSGLNAHHDSGEKGISDGLLYRIISMASAWGDVWITAENSLNEPFIKYRLTLNVEDMHHYLYYANMLICDSQSMAVEAAILGTPSVRISSFAGKISVLEEIEHKYGLTFGFHPDEEDAVLKKLEELHSLPEVDDTFRTRSKTMLSDKIDVASFVAWFIENYPDSKNILAIDPQIQNRFKNGTN